MRLFIYEFVSAGGLGGNATASLRREGAAMLDAVVKDFERIPDVQVLTLLADDFAGAVGLHPRRAAHADEPGAFREIAAAADAALIIAPEFDDLLDRRTGWASAAGCRILGCTRAAIRLTGDKFKLARWLRCRRIPTPPTQIVPPNSPVPNAFPCVLKPRHGAGSQATFVISSVRDWRSSLEQARREWPAGDLILQPLHPGQAASVAMLIGHGQIVPTPGATQRLSADGRCCYEGGAAPLPHPLRIRAVALARQAVAAIAGLQGWVGIDIVLGAAADGCEDAIIEINPRLTTSYIGLRQLTRANLAEVWLRLWHGETADELAWSEQRIEFGLEA